MEIENLKNTVKLLSEKVDFVTRGCDIKEAEKTLVLFSELVRDIPDDVKETKLYVKIEQLKNNKITYDDVVWIVKQFDCCFFEMNVVEWLDKQYFDDECLYYINNVINSDLMSNREKLVIVLAHVETIIYDVLNIEKQKKYRIKNELQKDFDNRKTGMNFVDLGWVFVLAITYIVFANTDDYDVIDKNVPFRNNILHNGVVGYTDEEIQMAYELLVIFVCMLVRIKALDVGC